MSPTPEEQCGIDRQAGGLRQQGRAVFTRVALVLCGAILMLLFMLYRDAQDAAWHRPLLFLIVVLSVLAIVALFGRNPLQVTSRVRTVSVEELEMKGIDIQKLVGQLRPSQETGGDAPTGISLPPKIIHNLAELPPEVAGRPELQKLFQDAQAAGGAMWISTSKLRPGELGAAQLSGPVSQGPASQEKGQRVSGAIFAVVLLALCGLIGLALIAFRFSMPSH